MCGRKKVQNSFMKRIVYPGAIYHLTQRAPGKEPLFLEDGDYLRMLALLKEAVKKYNLNLFSFCLMSNHLHLLLKINKPNISLAAKYVFECYAKYFNSKYKRKGPVFCRPFRTRLCADDSYFLTVSVYIHLNPVKAGLSADVFSYRWSSADLYFKDKKYKTFVEYKTVLNILADDLAVAREEYKKIVNKADGYEVDSGFFLKPHSFIRKIRIHATDYLLKRKTAWSLEEEIAKFKKIKRCKLKDKKAKKYLVEQLFSNGYKVSEIAELLEESVCNIYKFSLKK